MNKQNRNRFRGTENILTVDRRGGCVGGYEKVEGIKNKLVVTE